MMWGYLKDTMKNWTCLAGLKTVEMHLPMKLLCICDWNIYYFIKYKALKILYVYELLTVQILDDLYLYLKIIYMNST